jgi:hypothetical protein
MAAQVAAQPTVALLEVETLHPLVLLKAIMVALVQQALRALALAAVVGHLL